MRRRVSMRRGRALCGSTRRRCGSCCRSRVPMCCIVPMCGGRTLRGSVTLFRRCACNSRTAFCRGACRSRSACTCRSALLSGRPLRPDRVGTSDNYE
jgi:hypothetical protein